MRNPQEYQPHLDQGRLLLLSPFLDKPRRPTIQTALYRNHFVAALADRLFVPYAAPASKTFELCRLALSWGKPLYALAGDANADLLALGATAVSGPEEIFTLLPAG